MPKLATLAPPVSPLPSPLETADGRAVRVVHLAAELAPFARSGGLGEAVNSLARYQAASGLWTAIVMPLYDAVRATGADLEPVGAPFNIRVGPRAEEVRLWRHNADPDHPLAGVRVYFADRSMASPQTTR